MSGTLHQTMTVAAFLDWEDSQPIRYEFDGFRPCAMTGGSAGHSRVQRNLIAALVSRLRGTSCGPFGSELKIMAATSVRYPDAFVVCSPVRDKATVVSDPVVVFEIISPSTSGVDRIIKNQEYQDTPSIRRYVILEQDRQAATVFSRDHGNWAGHVMAGETDLAMPEIGIRFPWQNFIPGWNWQSIRRPSSKVLRRASTPLP